MARSLYSPSHSQYDYFHLEGIGHAMKAPRELGSAPIYDSYSPTYNPSHGPQEGERDAPRTLVTLHLPTSSSGTGKSVHRILNKRIEAATKHSN